MLKRTGGASAVLASGTGIATAKEDNEDIQDRTEIGNIHFVEMVLKYEVDGVGDLQDTDFALGTSDPKRYYSIDNEDQNIDFFVISEQQKSHIEDYPGVIAQTGLIPISEAVTLSQQSVQISGETSIVGFDEPDEIEISSEMKNKNVKITVENQSKVLQTGKTREISLESRTKKIRSSDTDSGNGVEKKVTPVVDIQNYGNVTAFEVEVDQ